MCVWNAPKPGEPLFGGFTYTLFFNSFDGICGELTSCLCCVCDTKAYIQFSYFFWIYYGVTSYDWAVWIFLTGKYTCVCYLGTILGFASSCRMCRTEFRSQTLEMWAARWLSPYLIKRIANYLSFLLSSPLFHSRNPPYCCFENPTIVQDLMSATSNITSSLFL